MLANVTVPPKSGEPVSWMSEIEQMLEENPELKPLTEPVARKVWLG
jgi:hypothetical protein